MPSSHALPHNRMGVNYREVPPRKVSVEGGIIDAHSHTREVVYTQTFVDAAGAYGMSEFYTMCPLEHVPALKETFPGKFHFIAVPAWAGARDGITQEFVADWARRAEAFYALGARLIKFHAAPGTCRRWGMTLEDQRIVTLAKQAYDLGYHFMTHVGDPKAWFYGAGTYADGTYGSFESQFAQLDRMLERYPDRVHLGAHMGGAMENLAELSRRLDKFPQYVIDTSATKWIVRAVAEQSLQAVRDFVLHYQDRIVFGSDLVVGDKYDWDHYASRYWVHQMLWETDYRDQSPIVDPDAGAGFDPAAGSFDKARADGVPRIVGLNLPVEVLRKLYRGNAQRVLPR